MKLGQTSEVSMASLLLDSNHPIEPVAVPLRLDEGGAVRIGRSRVTLDVLVEQYENGMSAEDLCRVYDSLELADVHAVIAYYLRHQEDVQAYLKRRKDEAESLRSQVEAGRPAVSRQQLLARRNAAEKGDATAGS
jgi:uncharacterized protein (DUF433 family)